jgi:TolB-like protein
MKKIIITALLLAAAFAAWGQQVVVAVMPFEVRDRVVTDVDAENFTSYFSNELAGKRILRLSSRAAIDDAIKREFAQQQSDWSDAAKTAEVGRVLNADWIVIGVVSKAGSRIMLNISLFELNTREQLPGVTRLAGTIDDVYDAMNGIVDELATRISGTPARSTASANTAPPPATDNSAMIIFNTAPETRLPTAPATRLPAASLGALTRALSSLIENTPPRSVVAVLNVSSMDRDLADSFIAEIESQLAASSRFSVVEERALGTLRSEMNIQKSGKVNDSSAVLAGQKLGANVVFTGEISGSGNNRRLAIRALDVRTGRIISMVRERF